MVTGQAMREDRSWRLRIHLRLLAFSLSEMGSHCKVLTREITWLYLSSKKIVLAALLENRL